jgi:hypothetical protein
LSEAEAKIEAAVEAAEAEEAQAPVEAAVEEPVMIA